MPDSDRRWSGAFRTCTACGKRNFVGRVACTACGASLQSPASPGPPAPAPLDGRRESDRIQGRSLAVAGGAVALVAIAVGVLVSRSLRAPDWARIPAAIAEVVAPPSRASSPEAAPLPAPTFPRPEDRASYEQGRRLLAAGEAKRALGPLGEASRGLPQDPAVAHDYGLALVGAGEVDRGLFQLEHASRLAPGIQSYRLDLIRALVAAGRRGPAARELQELLVRDPTNQSAAEMLAGLAGTTGSPAGEPAPGVTSPSVDLGGAAGGNGPPRPAPVGGAFTNEDLGRRPGVAPVTRPPSGAPSAPSPAASASPGPGA